MSKKISSEVLKEEKEALEARQQKTHNIEKLSDVILGGQDGLVNTLAVILGVAAAEPSIRIILAAGFAAMFGESVSMAAVAYTSKIAERDYYNGERDREKKEIEEIPEIKKTTLRAIYQKKGFEGKVLDTIVDTIVTDKKIWLQTMMRDELGLQDISDGRPHKGAIYVGLSALVGAFIPTFPFLFLDVNTGIIVSIVLSGISLFAVGAIKAKMTVGNWGKTGLELTIIGIVAALVGFGIGRIFGV